MKLQKASCFAIYAVLELAANPTHQLSGTEIADKYGISAHHLAKVLRDLGRARIVDAVRGVGGGYQLIANPKRLTLLDVIELFEPIGRRARATSDAKTTTDASAALRLVLNELDDHAVATFRSITISTMLKLMARRPWANATSASRPARNVVAHR
ncbi:MAG TPA: Rrf2 family transcriptional regulator [Candidatus Dormibacteraeota bacterium]|nr:Rrf2 family transcriptional regulator [Candidatus Dormibacteraeota bacterium]